MLSHLHLVGDGDRFAPLTGLEQARHERCVVVHIRCYPPLLLHALQTQAKTNDQHNCKSVRHTESLAWGFRWFDLLSYLLPGTTYLSVCNS